MEIDPVALLLIRVWKEHGSEQPLRAEVKLTCDTRHGFERQLVLSDAEAIHAALHAWLNQIIDGCG